MDVVEGGEDEVFDAGFLASANGGDSGRVEVVVSVYLGCVGDVLALLLLKLIIHLFPVIGHGEDAMSAFERYSEGGFVIQLALKCR